MKKKRDGDRLFWISYSDLMTSLFFVMMILFAVMTVKYMLIGGTDIDKIKKENKELRDSLKTAMVTIEQSKVIEALDKQFKPIRESDKFIYLKDGNRYMASDFLGVEIFEPNKTNILPEYLQKTEDIGREVEKLLVELNEKNKDLGYILLIEGNAANSWDKKYGKDDNYGYTLSYGRALSVYKHWLRNGIDLRKYNTEVIIAGSGFNGMYRDSNEDNNKRFTIQILPKISDPGAKNR